MKKLMVPLAVMALLALAVPAAFAEWELGIGISPAQNQTSITPGTYDGILNFHVGYSWSILYASWDAFAMPNYWVYNATTYVDPVNGWYYPGIDLPGFLNLFDVGIKIVIKPVIAYAEIGTNMLYLYGGQIYKDPSGNLGVGVNGRLGAGVKFGFWGVNISGTQVFATFNDLKSALDQAFHHGNTRELTDGSVLSLNFSLYF